MAFPPKDRSGRPGRPAAPTGTGSNSSGRGTRTAKPAPYKIPAPRVPKAPAAPQTRALADDGTAREGDRIAKLLARAGIASRREIERYIAEGRIALGGEVITTPATILKNLKGVTVDGNPVAAAEPPRLFMFHKPSGLITAERDPTGRPTIYTALRNALPEGAGRVMPVGRLDINTEGLLLLTNDGELKRAMELPANAVPRTYRARTFGDVSQLMLDDLMQGIEIEGIRYGPINANMERSAGRNKWIELTLTEGKNREVRRVLEHLGLEVSRLLRLRYGPFDLGELPRGGAEEVPQIVVERFRKGLAGDHATRVQQAVHAGKAYAPRAPKPVEEAAKPAKFARPARQLREPERPSRLRAEPERPSRERPARVRPSADAGQLVAKPAASKPAAKTYPNRPYAKAPADVPQPSPGPDARAPSKTLRSSPRKPGGRPGAKR